MSFSFKNGLPVLVAGALFLCISASAQDKASVEVHGFIRNYYAFDTREGVKMTDDLFFYIPYDENVVDGDDLQEQNTFRTGALTSRLWVETKGYEVEGLSVSSRIEFDFYTGLSSTDKVSGTATCRLRQAFVTFGKDSWSAKLGQAWHPMAADMVDVFSLSTGSPFGPFGRNPLVQYDMHIHGPWSITAALLWQMQYNSAGPDGSSAKYIKWGCTPETYVGLNYKSGGLTAKAGVDVSSIAPRIRNEAGARVSERMTSVSPFVFVGYKKGDFSIKAKSILAQDGSHMNLNGGYAIVGGDEATGYTYAPSRNSSSWVSLSYGKKWQFILFGGYVKNFGVKGIALEESSSESESSDVNKPLGLYWCKHSFDNMNSMWRVTPSVVRNLGKLQFGVEYEMTTARYGDKSLGINPDNGLYDSGLHNVTNHRVQAIVKYSF